jgi:hypothetical protein
MGGRRGRGRASEGYRRVKGSAGERDGRAKGERRGRGSNGDGRSERDGESELEEDGETKRLCYYVVQYMNVQQFDL